MKRALFLIAIILIAQTAFAQERADLIDSIRMLDKLKSAHLAAIEDLDARLEGFKLDRVRLDLHRNGWAACEQDDQRIDHTAYSLGYNEKHEQANWVAHILTSDIRTGQVRRTNDFREDSLLTSGSAVTEDYWDSGYDRGHLAPSADFRWSRKALSESYYYSNMSPQLPEFNRGIWAELENKVRGWTLKNQELYVVSGGVLTDGLPQIGVINKVSIPAFYYKVLLDFRDPEIKAIGFILPHQGSDRPVLEYAVSIDSVERFTGIDFFPALPDVVEEKLESKFDPELWPEDPFKSDTLEPEPITLERGMVNATDARHYIGTRITVCGTVVATKYNRNGNTDPTYINLDKTFPDQVFTLVIYGKDRINFSYEPEEFLKGKQLCVRGKVEAFRGTPQIVVKDEHKIRIIGEDDY